MTTSEKCELALLPANAESAVDSIATHRHSTRCVERSCCVGSTGGEVGWAQTQCRVTAGCPQHDVSVVPQQPPQRSTPGESTRAVHGLAQPVSGAAPAPMISASVSMVLVREGCMASSSSRVLQFSNTIVYLIFRPNGRPVKSARCQFALIKRSARTNGSVRRPEEDAWGCARLHSARSTPREPDQHVKRDSSIQRSRAVLHRRRTIAANRDAGCIAVTIAIVESDDNATTSWRSWRLSS